MARAAQHLKFHHLHLTRKKSFLFVMFFFPSALTEHKAFFNYWFGFCGLSSGGDMTSKTGHGEIVGKALFNDPAVITMGWLIFLRSILYLCTFSRMFQKNYTNSLLKGRCIKMRMLHSLPEFQVRLFENMKTDSSISHVSNMYLGWVTLGWNFLWC